MPLSDADQRDEWELKMTQIRMDVVNKWIDAQLKAEQRRWEPWKAMATIATAAVVLTTGVFSLALWMGQHAGH